LVVTARHAPVDAGAWSSGRTAVLGDAAYCASPISGMGTSLALAGAYVLAHGPLVAPGAPTVHLAAVED
jgi:2-polyprenyl-6-methoxyphenol hydroxylase-like FAD-dependent oxidoreductase